MNSAPLRIIYTILADDVPVAALEATGKEARELIKEDWFRKELSALKVHGEPIYKLSSALRVRPATEPEWTVYEEEMAAAEEDGDELFFAYLVGLDVD
jgi:hypothetical protein